LLQDDSCEPDFTLWEIEAVTRHRTHLQLRRRAQGARTRRARLPRPRDRARPAKGPTDLSVPPEGPLPV